jgi:transcriptional regulator with XRE-family HTH domain
LAKSLTDPRYRAMVDQLVALRHETGLTQRVVADRLGVVQAYVWKVEKYQQRLDPLQLVEWLRAIGADEKKFLIDVVASVPSRRKRK